MTPRCYCWRCEKERAELHTARWTAAITLAAVVGYVVVRLLILRGGQ